MQYLKPKFSLPASDGKITQEEWDRIFGLATDLRQVCMKHGIEGPVVLTRPDPETAYGNLLPE